MKNKNVLISGGLGFLGSHFCKILSKNNFNVILIDKVQKLHQINQLYRNH